MITLSKYFLCTLYTRWLLLPTKQHPFLKWIEDLLSYDREPIPGGLHAVGIAHPTLKLLEIHTHSHSLSVNWFLHVPALTLAHVLSLKHSLSYIPSHTNGSDYVTHAQAIQIHIPLTSVMCLGLCTRPQVNQYKSSPWLSCRNTNHQTASPMEKNLLSKKEGES